MTDDRSPIIKPTLDATGVRRGAQQVEDTMRDMAGKVGAEGRKAAEGVEAIGEGGRKGAQTMDREVGRMVGSIQRAQAAAQAGGRQTAEYFEQIAKQRGLNVDQLRPYLDGLRQAEAAQAVASASLGTMGMSAKATANALRGVPAQFTDIFTSLASGQQPLTVFLQQGGQLKDMFGGAGEAARALGGYVLGLINPYTLLAGVVGVVATGFVLGGREAQEYAKALILSGNAAGVSAGRLAEMAAAIDAAGPATESKAAEVLTQLAAAGEVGAQNLQRFAQAAIELERAGGPAAEETAKAFAALAKEPLAASIKLTESTRYLTAATAEQIAELEKQGKTTEAARIAQEAYFNAIDQRTPQLVERLGLVERAWKGITDATKKAGDAVLKIGRPGNDIAQEVERLQFQLERNNRFRAFTDDRGGQRIDQDNAKITARLRLLQQGQAYEALSASYAAQINERNEAGIRWLKEGDKYLNDKQRLSAEIARIQAEGLRAGRSEAEIAERVALARAKATPKGGSSGNRDEERALEQQLRLVGELSGVSSTYVQDLQRLDAARRAGLVGEDRYLDLMQQLIARQPAVREQAQAMARAAKDQAAAVLQAEEAYRRYLAGLDQTADAGQKTLDQLRLELVELTAGKQVRLELELQERERLAITYDQAAAAAELDRTDATRYRRLAAQMREEISLRRQVVVATDQGEVRRANQRAAEEAARDWDRTANQVGQSLADALFEGGKSAGDLIKGYFRSLVLKPLIEAQLRPFVDALGGALGLRSAGGAAGAGNATGGAILASQLGGALKSVGLGNVGQSISASLSNLGPQIAAVMLARSFGQAISDGYSVGGSPNRAVNVGQVLGGPIGAIAGGVINRLFGRKLKDSGFEGSFGTAGDFSGTSFEFLKGGLFRSDKTRRGPLDNQLAQVLDAGGLAAFKQAEAYAEVLGLPVEALAGYTQKIKVSLKGLSEEQAQAAVADAVESFQEGLLGRFRAQLAPLQRTGETLTQVAARVAELQTFAQGINELGGVFSRVAALSLDAREQLIAMAGGLDVLNGQALNFVQQYYTRDEIAGVKARELQGVLTAAGISQDVATRDQFRALVESADVNTESGRAQLAQLLRVAGDFADVAEYLAETGGTLASVATLAPTSGTLAALFSPQQLQIDAINNVGSGVRQVDNSVNRLIDIMSTLPGYTEVIMGGA